MSLSQTRKRDLSKGSIKELTSAQPRSSGRASHTPASGFEVRPDSTNAVKNVRRIP